MDVKLYISVCSNRANPGAFTGALAGLMYNLGAFQIRVPGYTLADVYLRSTGLCSTLSIARQAHVDEMLAGDYTHWLSLDDDMTFPMDIVDLLIAHDKDVVSCNSRAKQDQLKGSCVGMDKTSLDSTGKNGLEEVRTMGGAIFLAKIDCFRNIPKPHFQVLWYPAVQGYLGEDVHFAALLRASGVKLWVDHDVSNMVGHVGDFEYKWPRMQGKNNVTELTKLVDELNAGKLPKVAVINGLNLEAA